MTERGTEDQGEHPRLHIQFTDEESAHAHTLAAWYGGICDAHNMPVPPDPMRCLLAASVMLFDRVCFLESILQAEGIDPAKHLQPAGRPH